MTKSIKNFTDASYNLSIHCTYIALDKFYATTIITGVIPISLPVLSTKPVSDHTCKSGWRPKRSTTVLTRQQYCQSTAINLPFISNDSLWSTATFYSAVAVGSAGKQIDITPIIICVGYLSVRCLTLCFVGLSSWWSQYRPWSAWQSRQLLGFRENYIICEGSPAWFRKHAQCCGELYIYGKTFLHQTFVRL